MARDIKSRLRLHLRAERAFGLKSIPVSTAQVAVDSEIPDDENRHSHGVAASVAPVVKPTEVKKPKPTELFVPDADSPPFPGVQHSPDEKKSLLVALNDKEVRGCTKCRLCETRTNTVFGEGDANARIFFIGEGPGENEDLQGRPFIGRAGELLNKWIAAMGLNREQVYIANIVKCRPPGNREPAPDEVATCTPYLQRQLEIIRPQVIITLGKPSGQYMLQSKLAMGKLRGQWHAWRGIKLMPTYHPAYVLRSYNYETRSAVWSDLQKVMSELGLSMPAPRT